MLYSPGFMDVLKNVERAAWTLGDQAGWMDTEVVEDVSVASSQQVLSRFDRSEVEQTPAQHVNQVLAQVGQPSLKAVAGGIHVTFLSVSPPVITPDDDRRVARVAESPKSVLKVTVHASAPTEPQGFAAVTSSAPSYRRQQRDDFAGLAAGTCRQRVRICGG